jgi:hypothetical protein
MIDPITQYILEGYLFNNKTIAVNLPDFEKGINNKLIIIGNMGSGKTTWAEFLSKNKAYMVKGRYPARLPRIEYRSADNIWFNLHQKYFKGKPSTKENRAKMKKLVAVELNKLLHAKKRIIMEGVDFLDMYRDNPQHRKYMLKQSMIIVGMSSLRAGIRAGKRNKGEGEDEPIGKLMYWMSTRNMKEHEGVLTKLRKDVRQIPGVFIEPYEIPSLD